MGHKTLSGTTRYWAAWSKDHRLAALAKQCADENDRLRAALHAAISRPAGVVPDIALEFYDPKHSALGNMAQR